MIFYDFTCPNNHTTEHLVSSDTQEVTCPECGQPAKRVITGTSFKLEGTSGDFPTAADKWAKRHEKESRLR
jgi:putative FmdB family regulatory protein